MRRLKRLVIATLLAGSLSAGLVGSALALPIAATEGLTTAGCAIATHNPAVQRVPSGLPPQCPE